MGTTLPLVVNILPGDASSELRTFGCDKTRAPIRRRHVASGGYVIVNSKRRTDRRQRIRLLRYESALVTEKSRYDKRRRFTGE